MYKQYEFKPPDMIKERIDKDYSSILHNTLTSIPKVNKTDVETLRSTFGVRISESYTFLLVLIEFRALPTYLKPHLINSATSPVSARSRSGTLKMPSKNHSATMPQPNSQTFHIPSYLSRTRYKRRNSVLSIVKRIIKWIRQPPARPNNLVLVNQVRLGILNST